MIAFWSFFFGVLAGLLIGVALRNDPTLPPASSRRIRRSQRAARADLRADLRAALGDRVIPRTP